VHGGEVWANVGEGLISAGKEIRYGFGFHAAKHT